MRSRVLIALLRSRSLAVVQKAPPQQLIMSATNGLATAAADAPTPLVPVKRIAYQGDLLRDAVSACDPEAYSIMQKEKRRQRVGLELIASENFTSKAVCDALSCAMTNKYSEGYPGARYYGGNEYIDEMEVLCQKRALEVFGLDPEVWGVNVQSLSGTPANFAVYTALVGPHGRIMGLDLPDGGHLSHGFFTAQRRVSATSIFFESMPYKVDADSGLINYEQLERDANMFKPKMIIAGMSCYARHLNYLRFRQIANATGALLLADMAHISGLVAAGVVPSPFEFADVVTTTTHKSLRGPRGALIFYRKGVKSVSPKGEKVMFDLADKINSAVFPGLQGGPHNHTISAIAVCLRQCLTPEFVTYAKQILANAQALSNRLIHHGYSLATGGTDNHLCLLDLRPKNTEGAKVEYVLDLAQITCNKNTCPGDKSAFRPGGIRLGTPALTSRGFTEKDFEQVADFIHQGILLTIKYQSKAGKTLKELKEFCEKDADFKQEVEKLGKEVMHFTDKFPMPGNEDF